MRTNFADALSGLDGPYFQIPGNAMPEVLHPGASSGDEMFGVGRKRQAINAALMARELAHAFSFFQLPHPYGFILARGERVIAIWKEADVTHGPAIAGQSQQELSFVH